MRVNVTGRREGKENDSYLLQDFTFTGFLSIPLVFEIFLKEQELSFPQTEILTWLQKPELFFKIKSIF